MTGTANGAFMEKGNKLILGGIAGAAAIGGLALLANRRAGFDYTDKSVLIMGGSRGLGLVMARELIMRGARVAICARDAAELERAEADLAALGGDVMSLVCDVRTRSEIKAAVEDVRGRFGQIDVLINNAGIIRVGPLELQTDRD